MPKTCQCSYNQFCDVDSSDVQKTHLGHHIKQSFIESLVYIHVITSSLLWRLDWMFDTCSECWPTERKASSNLTRHLIVRDICESHRQDADNYTHTHKHTSVAVPVILCTSNCGSSPWWEQAGFQTPGQSEGPGLGRTLSPWASVPASFCSMEVHHAPANHQIKTTSGVHSQATIRT